MPNNSNMLMVWDEKNNRYVGISSIKGDKGDNYIITEDDKQEIVDKTINSLVGRKTLDGGEIFNDYENNQASGKHSHAENNSIAEGEGSHAENNSKASGKWSHSENQGKAIGTRSHAEGSSTALGTVSHAEGSACKATNTAAHAEGTNTEAAGQASHAQGNNTSAKGSGSHAAGSYSRAEGAYSHSEGHQTRAYGEYQWAIGKWNKEDKEDKYAFMIGNGKGPNTDRVRSNAFAVDWDGNGEVLGKLTIGENPANDMDVATKNYVDNELATFDFIKIIDELPETGLPNKIYLVPKANTQNNDLFDEYIWINEAWEFITTKQVEVDLTDYVKNTELVSDGKAGLVFPNEDGGIMLCSDGYLGVKAADSSIINNRNSIEGAEVHCQPIVPSNLDYATKVGITSNTIPLTAEEQTAAQEWLGIENKIIKKLDTRIRSYNEEVWKSAHYGIVGDIGSWDGINNIAELSVGDLVYLEGVNTTNRKRIRLTGEVTQILSSEKIISMKNLDYFEYLYNVSDTYEPNSVYQKEPISTLGVADALEIFNNNKIKYHKIRNEVANFELKKGHIYAFSVSNEDNNKAYIVGSKITDLSTGATTPNTTITGIASKTLDSMNNGFVMIADRCTAGGLTGTISLLNTNAFVNDKWNYTGDTVNDAGNNFKPPYYLKTTTSDGIDIWEI